MKIINIKLLRESKNITQEELAKLLGYKKNGFISQIETGTRKPPLNLEIKLTDLFGDISDFYEDIPDEPTDEQDLVVLPKAILDNISKLTDTILSQQRTIEKLVNQKIVN